MSESDNKNGKSTLEHHQHHQQENSPSNSLLQLAPVTTQHKIVTEDDMRNLYFGDFMRGKEEMAARCYEEITNLDKLKHV